MSWVVALLRAVVASAIAATFATFFVTFQLLHNPADDKEDGGEEYEYYNDSLNNSSSDPIW